MLVTLGLATWVVGLLVALFLFICVLLVLTVLIQRPQGGGLSGAFGSNSGSGQTAFGAKTGDALTIATIGMFVLYVVAAVGLNYAVRPAAPAAATTPAAAGTTPAGAPAAGTPATEGTTPAAPVEQPADGAATTPAPATGEAPSFTIPPTDPAPTNPAPANPAPTDPGTAPAPSGTDPKPADPAPASPTPSEPAPSSPAPATPPTPAPTTPPAPGGN